MTLNHWRERGEEMRAIGEGLRDQLAERAEVRALRNAVRVR
jgi:hypothetical protein